MAANLHNPGFHVIRYLYQLRLRYRVRIVNDVGITDPLTATDLKLPHVVVVVLTLLDVAFGQLRELFVPKLRIDRLVMQCTHRIHVLFGMAKSV